MIRTENQIGGQFNSCSSLSNIPIYSVHKIRLNEKHKSHRKWATEISRWLPVISRFICCMFRPFVKNGHTKNRKLRWSQAKSISTGKPFISCRRPDTSHHMTSRIWHCEWPSMFFLMVRPAWTHARAHSRVSVHPKYKIKLNFEEEKNQKLARQKRVWFIAW